MSFTEYLKERISNDYKNLIIQKLEEIREQTQDLKNSLIPSLLEAQVSARENAIKELSRLQESLEAEGRNADQKSAEQVNALIEDHISNWYHSDVSPFEQQLELLLSDIVSNIPEPPKKKSEDLEVLVQLYSRLDTGNTQSEILNILLQGIAGWVDRAILFVVKGEEAFGWAALGLSGDWDARRVKQIKVDLRKQTILREVISTGGPAHGSADAYSDNGELFLALGNMFPKSTVACPIYIRQMIAGILYADMESELPEDSDLPDLLYLASRAAGFSIDVLPLRPKVTPPKPVTREEAVRSVTEAVAEKDPNQEASAEEETTVAEEEAEPEEDVASETEEEAEEETPEVETAEPAVGSVPAPELEVDDSATVAMILPPIITPEEQKLHDDAKRFARLLVSEIKLYNEAQVSAGRENRDLYERLRDDIERSRRMYMERVPENIHSSTNYFYEELVRTLANGDPTLLGM